MRHILPQWLHKLVAFGRDRGGNVAITFAFATLPLIAAVGSAVDYSRANAVKASLQTAIDSTALLLAKEARTDTADQLQINATKYFKAMFAPPDAKNITVGANFTTGGTSLLINASAEVPTTLMNVFGFNSIKINASSTAKWGLTRLRVALVLDNSGSMADDGKMSALKTATKNLLTQLKNSSQADGDVYVSVIPFDSRVNIGKSNINLDWLDWTAWDQDWKDTHGTCSDGSNSPDREICETNMHCSDVQYTTKNICQNNHKTWLTSSGTWTPTITPPDHAQWNGCIYERGPSDVNLLTATGNDYDQVLDPSTSIPNTWAATDPIRGLNKLKDRVTIYHDPPYPCIAPMIGLTNDWTTLDDAVNNMEPVGFTNQPLGLVWGWQSLVGGNTFVAPPLDSNFKYEQAIILLTDGMNSFDRWYGDYNSSYTQEVDIRMVDSQGKGTCKNVKESDVNIYAIQVNTTGVATSQVMQSCASPGKFFTITSAADLDSLFQRIGDSLTKLRLAL
jgi:Flp pilus assembly protein TadG